MGNSKGVGSGMREILFRGKMGKGDWIYGCYVLTPDDGPVIMTCADWGGKFSHPVIPATVGQFTGLYDKNGKKIFEGDVMQLCSATYPCTVYWDGIGWAWKMNGKRRDIDLTREKMAVIGNIHDNQSW